MDFKFEYIVFAIVGLAIGSFLLTLFKHGGFKAVFFGAGIKNTVGEVKGNPPKFMNLTLKVHELEGAPEKAIGLELVTTSVGSYKMIPITLSITEAQKLTALISSITDDKQHT